MSNSEQLYNLIKEAFLLLDDGDQKLVGQFNLSVRRYYTLFWIGKEPGISFSELSQHMLVDKSSVTRIIKALEKDGYVIREAQETDGRSTRLFLTDRGKALQEQATIAHKDSVEHRFATRLSLSLIHPPRAEDLRPDRSIPLLSVFTHSLTLSLTLSLSLSLCLSLTLSLSHSHSLSVLMFRKGPQGPPPF
jgi:DNA-binding MarR family transcriptional regulator